MTGEPYRWLDAIAQRRDYVRDQLRGAAPVAAVSRPEGIWLFGIGQGSTKVFEIYDRHALAALGHPVDIERLRQAAIESAHLEGFQRAPRDVTLRRLVTYVLGPMLKTAFEQAFAPPLITEALFAELGSTPQDDVIARVSFDGRHRLETGRPGLALVALADASGETAAEDWLASRAATANAPAALARTATTLLLSLASSTDGFTPPADDAPAALPPGRTLEVGFLDRSASTPARYRPPRADELA